MRRLLLFLFCTAFFGNAHAERGYDGIAREVERCAREKKHRLMAGKMERIVQLKKQLTANGEYSPARRYDIYLGLYTEYKSFNFRQAYYYAQKLQQTGRVMNDPVRVAYGRVKMGFTLLSSGMFKETFDSLKTVRVELLPDSARNEYFFFDGTRLLRPGRL